MEEFPEIEEVVERISGELFERPALIEFTALLLMLRTYIARIDRDGDTEQPEQINDLVKQLDATIVTAARLVLLNREESDAST